jgi:UDP-glucose 4-epimerase
VAVTGAAGYIGRRIVDRLLAEDAVKHVVAVDLQPTTVTHPKLTYLRQDITAPLEMVFRDAGVQAVVHLAFVLRHLRNRRESKRINIRGMENVLRACDWAGTERIVLMSSSTVYGPRPDNTSPLTESSPLRPPPAFHYAMDKAASEELGWEYVETHPDVQLTVLRGCVVMGPNARNFITAALQKPLLIGIRGADPGMQFLHEDDLVEVLWEAVSKPRPGTYNVAGRGTVRWSEASQMAGKRLLVLPAGAAYALTEATWRLRLQNDAPSVGLDFIRWPWVVSTEKLEREFDYRPGHDSFSALRGYFDRNQVPGMAVHNGA